MSLLEKLCAENREAQRVADARERLLRHVRYLESSLVAMDAKYTMAVKGDLLSIEVSLTPPPRVEPPPVPEVEAPRRRLTLSGPLDPADPPKMESPAPESVVVPVEKDVPAPPQTLRSGTYSEAELATVHSMLDEGLGRNEIAAKLGRCPKAVSVKLVKVRADLEKARRRRFRQAVQPQPAPPERPVRPSDQPAPPDPAPPRQRDEPRPMVRPDHSEFPINEKALTAYLNALGYVGDWDAVKDFQLVGLLMQGMKLDMIAGQLKVTTAVAERRWGALNERIGGIDHQKLLLRILKQRAGLA